MNGWQEKAAGDGAPTARTKTRRGDVLFSSTIIPQNCENKIADLDAEIGAVLYHAATFHFHDAAMAARRGDRDAFLNHRRRALLAQAALEVCRGR